MPAASPERRGFRRLGEAVLVMLGIVAALQLASGGAFKVPHPPAVLLGAVVIAVMVGRQRSRLEARGEVRYRNLFTNVPTALYQTTPDGRFLAVNPAFSHLLGYAGPRDLDAVKADRFYVDPADRLRWVEKIDRDGGVRDYETRIRRKDGAIIWVRETARAIKDPLGRVRYYDGSLEDITERKRAEEQVRKLSLATEQSPSIVVITDTNERIE
ncbi:MAG: PAS domain-containing protein [bacterium]